MEKEENREWIVGSKSQGGLRLGNVSLEGGVKCGLSWFGWI